MNKSDLVSVSILCFNHEKYVAQAIESVLGQTYTNLEIIIVDNNSSDNSRTIVESYTNKDERIKFYSLAVNMFPSGGSNFAITKCTGEYIALLSADDYYEPNKIEMQLEYMKKNNLSNSFTWVRVVDDNGSKLISHPFLELFNQKLNSDDILKFFIQNGNVLCALTGMFHKSIFKTYGFLDHRLLQLQDFDFWIRLSLHEKITIYEESLTNYRVRSNQQNLSSENFHSINRSSFEYVCIIKNMLNYNNNILMSSTGKECNNVTKYKNIFNYYVQNNKRFYALSILFAMYEKLGNNFSYPSSLYNDFLECCSKLDLTRNESIHLYYAQVFLNLGYGFNEKNSIQLSVNPYMHKNIFSVDLSCYNNLKSLRVDPLNDSCVIEIEKLTLICKDGSEIDLTLQISANDCTYSGKNYFFENIDPQINFDFTIFDGNKNFNSLQICFKYLYISKDALYKCLEQKNQVIEQKDQVIEQKDQVILSIYSTKSWNLTKPLRFFIYLIRKLKDRCG